MPYDEFFAKGCCYMIDWYDLRNTFTAERIDNNAKPMRGFHAHLALGELIFVEEGKSTVITETSITNISGSYVIFYPLGTAHYQINDPSVGYRHYQIAYPESLLSYIPHEKHPHIFFVAPIGETQFERIRPYLERLVAGINEPNSEWLERERGYLMALLVNELELQIGRAHV